MTGGFDGYRIVSTADAGVYEGIRALWCRVFGDGPEYVDMFYRRFAGEIRGCAVIDEQGKVVSALTCYRYGSYGETPVYVSYAVCTEPESRGNGLASMLVSYVRDEVISGGGISLICPAEPSLIDYYEALGYVPCMTSASIEALPYGSAGVFPDDGWDTEDLWDEDGEEEFEAFEPELSIKTIGADEYNMYREAFLAEVPHFAMSAEMAGLVADESADGSGFLMINGGDALCTVFRDEEGGVTAEELLINPMLSDISYEIDEEIASRLAKQLGVTRLACRMPGYGGCVAMAAAEDGTVYDAYFAFPIE